MTVCDIVADYLKKNGFDGLYSEDCGCAIDDLMPCSGADGSSDMCEPGYKKKCGYAKEGCPEGFDFCIGPKDSLCRLLHDVEGK